MGGWIRLNLDIICEGAALVDMVALVERFPDIDDEVFVPKLEFMCGGSAANTTIACSKLNLKAGFLGKVGNDPFGNLLKDDFQINLINIDNLITSKELPTGNCYVAVDKKGNRILYAHSGAANELEPSEIDPNYIEKSRLIHLASLKNIKPLIKTAEIAKEKQVKVSLNPGALIADQPLKDLLPLIKNIDIFISSKTELEKIFNKKFDNAIVELKKFAEIIAITKGSSGCYIFDSQSGENYTIGAYKVDVRDTTGAGDAFSAGFLAGVLHDKELSFCGKMGNATAALCIQEIGARNGLPILSELYNFIKENDEK
jgi:ribokinase